MAVRGQRAEETRQRIVDAARRLLDAGPGELTLEKVAAGSTTSIQTVVRHFGNREGVVLAAIGSLRRNPSSTEAAPSPAAAVTLLFDDYEEIGDRVLAILVDEHRAPGFAAAASTGRVDHREWVTLAFGNDVRRHPARRRQAIITALVVATDVYVWKLLRRDLRLDRRRAEATMLRLVSGALGSPADKHKGGKHP
jgi:AcrR family transcriptional regulator